MEDFDMCTEYQDYVFDGAETLRKPLGKHCAYALHSDPAHPERFEPEENYPGIVTGSMPPRCFTGVKPKVKHRGGQPYFDFLDLLHAAVNKPQQQQAAGQPPGPPAVIIFGHGQFIRHFLQRSTTQS